MNGLHDITTDPFSAAFEAAFAGACSMFEEPVVFRVRRGTENDTRLTVRASLLFGSRLAPSAGVNDANVAGAELSAVVRRAAWPLRYPPEFGDRIEIGEGDEARIATVQGVESDGRSYTLSCSFDERVEGAGT